jgi:hypothetical protein
MAAKRKTAKRKQSTKKSKLEPKESGPQFNIQISNPTMVRKDILEGLREVIIFMQGYEKFRQIQEEKMATFMHLNSTIKSLHSLIDSKLRKYIPKGKLTGYVPTKKVEEKVQEVDVTPKKSVSNIDVPSKENELNELESQLRDIESQLQNVK